jgi:2'-5' RNA ligase
LEHIVKYRKWVSILFIFLTGAAYAQAPAVTAIDIALEPDAKTIAFVEKINVSSREHFPWSLVLDEHHHPHVTIVQCYARTARLDKIYAAVSEILASTTASQQPLTAYEIGISPSGSHGVAVIKVEAKSDLIELQKQLLAAVAPYTVKQGAATAFYTSTEYPDVNQATIDYVNNFNEESSGEHYDPHITVAITTLSYAKKMLRKSFPDFTFIPAAVTVFQLGNNGTATQRLKTWPAKG